MIFQTDSRLDPSFNKYGCLFDCHAWYREAGMGQPWTAEALDAAWMEAVQRGIIDHQFVLQKPQALCDFLGLNLKVLTRIDENGIESTHFPIDTAIVGGMFAITEWHNDRTGFTHFVLGAAKPVVFDPIEGGSVTVAEGYPVSYRLFQIV